MDEDPAGGRERVRAGDFQGVHGLIGRARPHADDRQGPPRRPRPRDPRGSGTEPRRRESSEPLPLVAGEQRHQPEQVLATGEPKMGLTLLAGRLEAHTLEQGVDLVEQLGARREVTDLPRVELVVIGAPVLPIGTRPRADIDVAVAPQQAGQGLIPMPARRTHRGRGDTHRVTIHPAEEDVSEQMAQDDRARSQRGRLERPVVGLPGPNAEGSQDPNDVLDEFRLTTVEGRIGRVDSPVLR